MTLFAYHTRRYVGCRTALRFAIVALVEHRDRVLPDY